MPAKTLNLDIYHQNGRTLSFDLGVKFPKEAIEIRKKLMEMLDSGASVEIPLREVIANDDVFVDTLVLGGSGIYAFELAYR